MSRSEQIILIGRSLASGCLSTEVVAAELGLAVTLVADAVSHPIAELAAKLLQLQSSLDLSVSGT
jgi:hypothetical protein